MYRFLRGILVAIALLGATAPALAQRAIAICPLAGCSTGGGSATPGGSDTQVQFNDANAFAGNSAFTFNKATGYLSATVFSGLGVLAPNGSDLYLGVTGNSTTYHIEHTTDALVPTADGAGSFGKLGNALGAVYTKTLGITTGGTATLTTNAGVPTCTGTGSTIIDTTNGDLYICVSSVAKLVTRTP
jgi:hypothetical protein